MKNVQIKERKTQMDRSKEISNISIIVYGILEEYLDNIAKELKNPMELSHFLTQLENRLAISLNLKMSTLQSKNE